MDLEIREFEQAIINFINSSGLPIEVKRLCMEEIVGQLTTEANKCINSQIAERNEKSEESEEKEVVEHE